MRSVIPLLLLVLVICAVIVCVQNDESVTVTLMAWSLVTPLWLVAVVVYLLGMFTGWGVAGSLKRSWLRVTESRPR